MYAIRVSRGLSGVAGVGGESIMSGLPAEIPNFGKPTIMATIPISIAYMLIGYFSQMLTEQQHQELDEWMWANEANQGVLEDCLKMTLLPKIFHPDLMEEYNSFDYTNLN